MQSDECQKFWILKLYLGDAVNRCSSTHDALLQPFYHTCTLAHNMIVFGIAVKTSLPTVNLAGDL